MTKYTCEHSGIEFSINPLSITNGGMGGFGWISVKDKLPKDQERVLAWLDCAHALLWYADGNFDEIMVDCFNPGTHLNECVTYWMPLPDVPK